MKNTYITSYMDIDGKIKKRNILSQLSIIIYIIFKYLFDRFFSIAFLIILMPLLIIISIIVKIDSNDSILYKQLRTGKNGKLFKIYKFRTMTKNDEYTKFGIFLRKTSLDELPQLIMIATGKMSFIGPRPWIPEYYEKMNDIQKHKYDVLPGLTGLAQVMGRNNLNIFEKINYDLIYIKKYSLLQDIKIIFLTIKILINNTGVNDSKNTIKKELKDLSEGRKKNEKN